MGWLMRRSEESQEGHGPGGAGELWRARSRANALWHALPFNAQAALARHRPKPL